MLYRKPQITRSVSAASTIQQQSWTENPTNGVYKGVEAYQDHQNPRHICTFSAYEADE